MARGKQTCKILKDIRRQIAEANDIEFVTTECRYKGDCLGTCPKCEAEVRYLEQQLRKRQLAGKLINLAGISTVSLAMILPITSEAQSPTDIKNLPTDSIEVTCADSVKVKGTVLEEYTNADGSTGTVGMDGASILNLTNGCASVSDINGAFEIVAQKGDTIQASFIGFKPKTIVVNNVAQPITFTLDLMVAVLGEVRTLYKYYENIFELYILGENNNPIPLEDVYLERVIHDAEGNDIYLDLYPERMDNDHCLSIFWNNENALKDEDGNPLKEAILRITVEGYGDPVTIKVKYPKRNTKKTIKFKHEKKK